MRIKLFVAIAALMFSVGSVNAEDIYISYSNFSEGNSMTNTDAEFEEGSSGSAYVWIRNGFPLSTGAILDVVNSNTSVVALTGGTVFNPAVLAGGAPFSFRWHGTDPMTGEPTGGQAGDVDPADVSAEQLTRFQGFTVNGGTGIVPLNTGPVFMDELYDATEDAFLFGRIDFDIVGVGDAAFSLGASGGDAGNIVHEGNPVAASFGGATITGSAIPEPTSAALIALTGFGLVARRRRR